MLLALRANLASSATRTTPESAALTDGPYTLVQRKLRGPDTGHDFEPPIKNPPKRFEPPTVKPRGERKPRSLDDDSTVSTASSVKFVDTFNRTAEQVAFDWKELRISQCLSIIEEVYKGKMVPEPPESVAQQNEASMQIVNVHFLEPPAFAVAERIVTTAAEYVWKHGTFRRFKSAHANLWATFAAQEAFARENPRGWETESAYTSKKLSFEHLREQSDLRLDKKHAASSKQTKIYYDADRQDAQLTTEREAGVTRSQTNHKFSADDEKTKEKVKELHAILQAAGDQGIRKEIRELHAPIVPSHAYVTGPRAQAQRAATSGHSSFGA